MPELLELILSETVSKDMLDSNSSESFVENW